MRKLSLLLSALSLSIFVSAQVPQALNYQAVARNSMGQIVPSQSIGVRFTITDANGATIFYQETHNTTTNNFGLFTLAIGKGTPVSGTMGAIDWSTGGDKYLKVEIAPQGGSNYTIQGMTQLLSVPYALYADKTKLVAGAGISITNGNTISTNAWLSSGNAGTAPTNYLGTSDNQPLRIKTNNVNRMKIDVGINDPFAGDIGIVYISDFNSIATTPGQLAIFGRDVPGLSMPLGLYNSVAGMNWAPQGGANNTMGRFIRLTQYATTNQTDGQFFDFGMDQGAAFYISEHGLNNQGPILHKKMFTITPQDFVGINFNWGETPTANFHTKGTVRFEGIAANNALTRVIVMDNNGNLAARDASTLGGGASGWALTGNGATTAANFLGTPDNQPLRIRTNNINRMTVDPGIVDAFAGNVGIVYVSDFSSIGTAPGQLSVFGKDLPGTSMPLGLYNSVAGMNWAPQGGNNNTMGRFFRLTQYATTVQSEGQFFDFGMDQSASFYISEHGLNNQGPILHKKMITITPQDFVGINFNWGEAPTANFHTKGTVRFEGIAANNALTRVVVMDNNGNLAARDASTLSGGSGWALTGNGATTAANFLGTPDNQPLRIRTNNINRMTVDPGIVDAFAGNVGIVYISDFSSIGTAPGQLSVFGKDLPGTSMPLGLYNSVAGMNWAPQGGNNNTMGRFFRLTQYATTVQSEGQFFDFGMDQGASFYISEHGLNNQGPILHKKMITITPQDFVGINFNWGEDPTANFHTKGTVRFQNLPSGTGNILVVDANGNVFRATQTATKMADSEKEVERLQSELDQAKKDIAELKAMITEIKSKMSATVSK